MNSGSLFGERLRIERVRLDLSQAAAGKVAGVSREMWGKYERGAMPGSDVLLRLAVAGFDMNYLFINQHSAAPVLSRDEEVLLDNFRNSSKNEQECLKTTSAAFAQRGIKKGEAA